jgi:hypothetical protein
MCFFPFKYYKKKMYFLYSYATFSVSYSDEFNAYIYGNPGSNITLIISLSERYNCISLLLPLCDAQHNNMKQCAIFLLKYSFVCGSNQRMMKQR